MPGWTGSYWQQSITLHFLKTFLQVDEKVKITATSHSFIVKGYVKILLDTLNGLTAKEIINAESKVQKFVEDTGISNSLVATRANAFGNIYQTIQKKVSALLQ